MFWHEGRDIMKWEGGREERRQEMEKEREWATEGKCWHECRELDKRRRKRTNEMCKGDRKKEGRTDRRGNREQQRDFYYSTSQTLEKQEWFSFNPISYISGSLIHSIIHMPLMCCASYLTLLIHTVTVRDCCWRLPNIVDLFIISSSFA